MRELDSRTRKYQNIGVGVLFALLVGAGAFTFIHEPTPPPVTEKVASYEMQPIMELPSAVVIGDSQSNGNTGVGPRNTWVSKGLVKAGWNPIVSGHGGTGFFHDLPDSALQPAFPSFADALRDDLYKTIPQTGAKMVVLQGGGNDAIYTDEEIRRGVEETLSLARAKYPEALFVIVGPLNQSASEDSRRVEVSRLIADIAREQGVKYIDTTDYFVENDLSANLLADGAHLDQAGHNVLAGELAEDLERIGVADPERIPRELYDPVTLEK